jgi:two-component system LytT family sensor kinase
MMIAPGPNQRSQHFPSLWSLVPWLTGLALLLSALEASQLYFRAALEGWPVTAASVLGRALASWLTFAALTPLALMAARRWPLHRPVTGRRLALHAFAASAFTLLHLSLTGGILTQVLDHPFGELASYLFVAYGAVDLLLYLVIVGGWQALETRRELAARELLTTRLESDLKRAQLEALQVQLHPHFLFNTLNAIAGMALRAEGQRTADAIAVLGELLRENLAPGVAAVIPLGDEVRMVERYFEVWRLRLGDQVAMTVSLAPGTDSFPVPRFLLQPLVENAVLHGIIPGGTPGRITITSQGVADGLLLAIEDDGVGPHASGRTGGLGLANVRERLTRAYGDRGRLTLTPRPGGGARAVVEIPANDLRARAAT